MVLRGTMTATTTAIPWCNNCDHNKMWHNGCNHDNMQYNNHDHDYNTIQHDNNDHDSAISWQQQQWCLNLHHVMLSALSINASGSVVAAFSATPISLTLAVPLVGAGLYRPCLCPPHSCTAMLLPTLQPHGLLCGMPCSWVHHIAACLAVEHTMLQHALWLDTPCHSPYHSCIHHITTHQAAARAMLPFPLQLCSHIAASLTAAHFTAQAIFLHVPSLT
jgi:hypothetical protein